MVNANIAKSFYNIVHLDQFHKKSVRVFCSPKTNIVAAVLKKIARPNLSEIHIQ